MTAVFHFSQADRSDGHGSNGADECQNKQTVGDKTKKINVSEGTILGSFQYSKNKTKKNLDFI